MVNNASNANKFTGGFQGPLYENILPRNTEMQKLLDQRQHVRKFAPRAGPGTGSYLEGINDAQLYKILPRDSVPLL